jgi:hypothetical protein
MMSREKSNVSVIDMSLTELAFIFFFLLLIFSAWKISDSQNSLSHSEQKILEYKTELRDLKQRISELMESEKNFLSAISSHQIDSPEELFRELKKIEEIKIEYKKTKASLLDLQEKEETLLADNNNLQQLLVFMKTSLGLPEDAKKDDVIRVVGKANDLKEIEEVLEKTGIDNIRELATVVTGMKSVEVVLAQTGFNDATTPEAVQALAQSYSDMKGQNINLREKLSKSGSGLDHPPCWADPDTGKIQYVFDAFISENKVEFKEAWPASRDKQAKSNPNINNIPGTYEKNIDIWRKTNGLYKESIAQECRHFVRIYDRAQSKESFKIYMRGIENHFYKFLVN